MRHTIARVAHLLGTVHFLRGRGEEAVAGVLGFRMPEADPSWVELGNAWELRVGRAIPASWSLREHLAERWVRFHSLPDSKRDADTEEEERMLLDRHHHVLAALRGSSDEVVVVLLRWDGQGRFRASREFRRLSRIWSFWRTFVDETTADDEDEAITASAFVRRLPATRAALDPWFRRAADDADVFVITNDAVDWVYAPYDGGADVITPTAEARDALSDRYSAWRSPRPDGL
ncbi:hypothetical protein [Cellulosimicrobium sp. SH8]|uniref:DUF3885 domain-containing protein n=1 Tax=Cellulosimicrobium sp. SH8 TaxID=2952936 RepID=UPI0021F38C9B|nr:hypothetical protein [Cellulosimicrobium sp. SH8]